jgi:hypothetical protein
MKNERLHQLLATYGAQPAKWPAADRVDTPAANPADLIVNTESGVIQAGSGVMRVGSASEQAESKAMLAEAAMLDSLLDSYRVSAPGPELLARIMASAPTATMATAPAPTMACAPTPVKRWFEHLWSGMGLGMAGVAAGGVLAGILLMSSILAPDEVSRVISSSPTADSSYLTTAFNGSSPLWSEE